MGPKNAPTKAVPLLCAQNKMNNTNKVIGNIMGCKTGAASSKPSTADNTEMAGVIMPSA